MKKGTALIWISMLALVLIIVTSSIVSYIVQESKLSINTELSAKAYSAARSGIEWGKYVLSNPPGVSGSRSHTMVIEKDGTGNPTLVARIVLDGPSEPQPNHIVSRGEYLSGSKILVVRQLEYTLSNTDQRKITPPINFTDPNNRPYYFNEPDPNCPREDGTCNPVLCSNSSCLLNEPALSNKNYVFQFDFWYRNISVPNPLFPPPDRTPTWPSHNGNNNSILYGISTDQTIGPQPVTWNGLSEVSGVGIEFETTGKMKLFYKIKNTNREFQIQNTHTPPTDFSLKTDYLPYANTADKISAYRVFIKVINGYYVSAKICWVVYEGDNRTDKLLCVGHGKITPANTVTTEYLKNLKPPESNITFNRVLARFRIMNNPMPPETQIRYHVASDTVVFVYNQPVPYTDYFAPGSYGFYFNNMYLSSVVTASPPLD